MYNFAWYCLHNLSFNVLLQYFFQNLSTHFLKCLSTKWKLHRMSLTNLNPRKKYLRMELKCSCIVHCWRNILTDPIQIFLLSVCVVVSNFRYFERWTRYLLFLERLICIFWHSDPIIVIFTGGNSIKENWSWKKKSKFPRWSITSIQIKLLYCDDLSWSTAMSRNLWLIQSF